MAEEVKEVLLNENSALNFLGTMKRYPFNGRSKYLIDKFFIIGYDYATLHKLLIKRKLDFIQNSSKNNEEELLEKNRNRKLPQEFEVSEPPLLINEISSDYNKEVLDIDLIIEMIFPNKPKFYYVEEDLDPDNNKPNNSTKNMVNLNEEIKRTRTSSAEGNIYSSSINFGKNKLKKDFDFNSSSESNSTQNINLNKEEYFPTSYNVIFSSNPQSGKNSKKSINGFAHIFYKKFNEKKKKNDINYSFFVPIAFCIISEFPYYNGYYQLTRQIMLLFKSKIIEVPIEFTLQNIVNYTLSPLNDDVILNIAPVSLIRLWKNNSSYKYR
jgi:hypothetical protein